MSHTLTESQACGILSHALLIRLFGLTLEDICIENAQQRGVADG